MGKINKRVKIKDIYNNKLLINKCGRIVGSSICSIVEKQYIVLLDEPITSEPFKGHEAFFIPQRCLEYL
jgi:hypothetical protein